MTATLAPSSRSQPPIVITSKSPAETSRTKAMIAFIDFDAAFSRFGLQISYPGRTLVASITGKSMTWGGPSRG
jgi:hypothetical protein